MWEVVGWGVSKRSELVVIKSICVRGCSLLLYRWETRSDHDKARSTINTRDGCATEASLWRKSGVKTRLIVREHAIMGRLGREWYRLHVIRSMDVLNEFKGNVG
jgi:hypothetical protein